VAGASLQHFGDGPLSQCEKSGQVDGDDRCVVIGGVVGEWLGDEDAGVVDERVDASEAVKRFADDPVCGSGWEMSPLMVSTAPSSEGLIVRELATTAQSRRR
jgi:hypothetical protein